MKKNLYLLVAMFSMTLCVGTTASAEEAAIRPSFGIMNEFGEVQATNTMEVVGLFTGGAGFAIGAANNFETRTTLGMSAGTTTSYAIAETLKYKLMGSTDFNVAIYGNASTVATGVAGSSNVNTFGGGFGLNGMVGGAVTWVINPFFSSVGGATAFGSNIGLVIPLGVSWLALLPEYAFTVANSALTTAGSFAFAVTPTHNITMVFQFLKNSGSTFTGGLTTGAVLVGFHL